MATLNLEVSDQLKKLVEERAAAAGCVNVSEFVSQLIVSEAAGPDELTVDSDDVLEEIIAARIDGPFVEMDDADFARIKNKFRQGLSSRGG